MKKLVIFDLDGTLIRNKSTDIINARQRLASALHEVFDIEYIPATSPGGMTDTSIFVYIARKCGIRKSEVMKRINELYASEIRYAELHVKHSGISRLKGSTQLLDRLLKEKHVVTVATGNIKQVAKIKLKRTGLGKYIKYFEAGGYGTVMRREELIMAAIAHAEKRHGKFPRENIFYFGDTRGDVRGGKKAKVVTIGVATGRESIEELKTAKPDYLLKDLADTKKVTRIINR